MSAALWAALMPHVTTSEPPSTTTGSPPGTRGGFDVLSATRGTARGDAAAFEVLYRAWFDRVYTFARGMTRRDESFCLDVTQEVMLRAAKSIPQLSGEAELSAWLTRASVSAAVDLIRREQRRTRREAARRLPGPGEGGPEQIDADELAWMRDALRGLSAIDQALLMQRVGLGVTLREAGRSVGIGEQAAHGRVRRALLRLQELAREVWP